jgi:uncharacterized protein YjiS (DUF1127 family)
MPSLLSVLAYAARSAQSVPAHRLAGLDDHLLSDLGLRRTDLYALPHLQKARIKAACCRLRDVAIRWLLRRRPFPCC